MRLTALCLVVSSGCVTSGTLDRALGERDSARNELAAERATLATKTAELAKARSGWDLVPIVVAAVDLTENSMVGIESISQRAIPAQFVTSSVVKPDSVSYIVNQKILVPVQAGDPLLWTQFETTRPAEHVSVAVGPNQRIISISVNHEDGVGGLVRPGDHVDVIAVLKDPKTNQPYAQTVLENAAVIATGKLTATTNMNLVPEKERAYGDVSLLVTSAEAQKLALAKYLGTLTLSIRSSKDEVRVEPRTTTIDAFERKSAPARK